jgi:hypothetical protein
MGNVNLLKSNLLLPITTTFFSARNACLATCLLSDLSNSFKFLKS